MNIREVILQAMYKRDTKITRFNLNFKTLTREERYKVSQQGVLSGAVVIPRYRNDKIYDYLFKVYIRPLKVDAMFHTNKKLPFIWVDAGGDQVIVDIPERLEKEFTIRLEKVLVNIGKKPEQIMGIENVKRDRVVKRLNRVFQYIRRISMADDKVNIKDNETLKAYGDAMGLLHKEYKKAAREFSKTLADFIEPLMNEMEMLADAFKTTGKGDIFKKRHRSLVKAYNEMQRLLGNAAKTKL
jgi:hypothetical protein